MKILNILVLVMVSGCAIKNIDRHPAEFGFSKIDSRKCLTAKGNNNQYYWKYENDENDWRAVKQNEASELHFTKAIPENIEPLLIECYKVWTQHFDNKINFDDLKKSVISINNDGTGFYISKNGFLLTNYHVAMAECKIPSNQAFNAEISCKGGYTLVAYPNSDQYFGTYDFALMKKTDNNIIPLKLMARVPKKAERVYLAGYPTRLYDDGYFENQQRLSLLPVVNSGKNSFNLKWDPLVFSTGVIEHTLFYKARAHTVEISSKSNLNIPATGGNSGSPLIDKNGFAVGILHRSDMYNSLLPAVVQLDLCNRIDKSTDPDRVELASDLKANNGICAIYDKFITAKNLNMNNISIELLTKNWLEWFWNSKISDKDRNDSVFFDQ